MDYGDYVVHIFSERARLYYDLERLWRDARTVAAC
jgi:ribosome-associated protein